MINSAKQSSFTEQKLDCFVALAPRNDVAAYDSAFSRRTTPEFCTNLPSLQRVQGMPDARCTRSLACEIMESTRASHHRFTGTSRHSLHNGFTVSFVLSPVSRALLPPSSAVRLRQLDTGMRVSGPHDFAVRGSTIRQARCPRPSHPTPRP
jgi:hypothetical protein